MKLYTKSGDNGTTAVVGGKRVAKTDPRICACGDIDELNAHIGLLLSIAGDNLSPQLTAIQTCLFHIGTALSAAEQCEVSQDDVTALENEIDHLQRSTPEPGTFVLPGGCRAAAQSHVCRTVCRRAERSAVALSEHHYADPIAMQYINRLSDYFFALALYLNFKASVDERKLYVTHR